jgi:hypothetical protein
MLTSCCLLRGLARSSAFQPPSVLQPFVRVFVHYPAQRPVRRAVRMPPCWCILTFGAMLQLLPPLARADLAENDELLIARCAVTEPAVVLGHVRISPRHLDRISFRGHYVWHGRRSE